MNCGIPLEHACGGSCACTTCHLIIRKGMENLSEMEDNEADRLDTAWDLTTSSRLGCQAVIKGDVVGRVPDVYAQLRPGGRRHPARQVRSSRKDEKKAEARP